MSPKTYDVIVIGAGPASDVAEWLHAATIAIVAEVPVATLWDAVPAFPTRSEIWLKLLERRETEIARPDPALPASA